jgi:hypothetical protein
VSSAPLRRAGGHDPQRVAVSPWHKDVAASRAYFLALDVGQRAGGGGASARDAEEQLVTDAHQTRCRLGGALPEEVRGVGEVRNLWGE